MQVRLDMFLMQHLATHPMSSFFSSTPAATSDNRVTPLSPDSTRAGCCSSPSSFSDDQNSQCHSAATDDAQKGTFESIFSLENNETTSCSAPSVDRYDPGL